MDAESSPAASEVIEVMGVTRVYDITVLDLQILFLTVAGELAGQGQQYAEVVVTKSGTSIFEHSTTVAALCSPNDLVSSALSLLNHPDPDVVDFLTGEVCSVAGEAAHLALLRGSRLLLDADIHVGDHPSLNRAASGNFVGRARISPEDFVETVVLSSWKMKMTRYSRGGKLFRETACAICLDGFEEGMRVGRMPCGHIFHEHCVCRWFRRSPLCPLCRSRCFKLEDHGEPEPPSDDQHAYLNHRRAAGGVVASQGQRK